MRALTNKGNYIELEALPSFCAIRIDLVNDGVNVPVGDSYISEDKIYLYAWSLKQKFYIFIKGIACEANSIDFDFPFLDGLSESSQEFVA